MKPQNILGFSFFRVLLFARPLVVIAAFYIYTYTILHLTNITLDLHDPETRLIQHNTNKVEILMRLFRGAH